MDSSISLLEPYKSSFAYDETERQLQALFIAIFDEIYGDQIKNIHEYGMPHFGSPTVVERFTKQDGLVVLRQSVISDIIMRVIYANWRSLASKRGLGFLEFILTMIWGDQWEISRLYHSVERADEYPKLATNSPTLGSFLTSRISITINQEVDADEIRDIAPMIAKLVPANIVAKIMSGVNFDDMDGIGLGMAFIPYAAANLAYFEELTLDRIPMTDWGVTREYLISGFSVRYQGFKTDLVDTYYSFAFIDLVELALSALHVAEYQQMEAVHNEIMLLKPALENYVFDNASNAVQTLIIPENYNANFADASAVMVARVHESANVAYIGKEQLTPVLDYLSWIPINGVLSKAGIADISATQRHMFQFETFKSYVDYKTVAQSKIQDLVLNDVDWQDRTLGEFSLESSTETSETYIQNYTYPAPEPEPEPIDPPIEPVDPPLEPEPEPEPLPPLSGQYSITVNKVDNPDFVSDNAIGFKPIPPSELAELFALAFAKADEASDDEKVDMIFLAMKQAYFADEDYPLTNSLYTANLQAVSYVDIITDMRNRFLTISSTSIDYVFIRSYLMKIAGTLYNQNVDDQLITLEQLRPQFIANAS